VYFKNLIPHYEKVKVPYTSPASTITKDKAQFLRLKEEVKFLYKQKDHLNRVIYHSLASSERMGHPLDRNI
jgi:hypothetical protein